MYSVDLVSNTVGIASDDYTLKLAVFHTIFNVIGVVVMIPFIGKLVIFLEKVLKDKEVKGTTTSTDTAQYLNDSVLEWPITAMAAITRETRHLYTNAFEIITHGLNLKRENITSAMPLVEVISHSYSESAIDIDDFYQHRIKGIYGEILDFSAKAQSHMAPDEIEKLYKIKLANRDIVEAVKDTKHLQKNLIKYDKTSNQHIKEQYDNIKIGLAELLRNIDLISKMTEEDEIILLLSKAKVHMQKYDILANGTLDKLIRHDLITNEMATSLMNDSTYAHDISKNFIAMAEIIFIDASGDIKNIGEDMVISDEDVDLILKEKDA